MFESVSISNSDKAIVEKTLASLGITPTDNLFYLDNLKRNTQFSYMPYVSESEKLSGSDEAKEKYYCLKDLVSACKCRCDYQMFLSSHDTFSAIHLALSNAGSEPAHHVTVEVSIPLAIFVHPAELPAPSSHFVAQTLEDYSGLDAFIEALYKPEVAPAYRPYSDSKVLSESGMNTGPFRTPLSSGLYGKDRVDESDYSDTIESLFGDYTFIKDADNEAMLVRLSFDAAQHCTSYTFPTLLFVEEAEGTVVHYRVTADEISKPVEGDLKITAD